MDKSENKRVVLTKQLLRSALLEMLKEVPIRDVSIRELCNRAGINRTTFYNHYASQYILFDDICQQFLNAISKRLKDVKAEDVELVHKRVSAVSNFAERIFDLPEIGDLLDVTLADFKDQRKKEAVRSFTIFGSQRLLQEWVNQDEHVSPEQEAAVILELARRVCLPPQGENKT